MVTSDRAAKNRMARYRAPSYKVANGRVASYRVTKVNRLVEDKDDGLRELYWLNAYCSNSVKGRLFKVERGGGDDTRKDDR
jgi:hypothetical protein